MLCLDRTLTLVLATHFLRARADANLPAPQISEEYDQRKNVKKKLEEQLVDTRKQLQENYNSCFTKSTKTDCHFRGATIDDMKYFLKWYLKRSPTNIILHCTNNSINDSSNVILNKLLSLKHFIHTELPESNVIL